MTLERSLVLNHFLHHLLGAKQFDDLRLSLAQMEEGSGPDGHSRFFHALKGRVGLDGELAMRLADYDRRIMDYEESLAHNRRAEPFRTFKYFQYLALLYTEIYLDRLTTAPAALLASLNAFQASRSEFAAIPPFQTDDLRRLAFFMATGSGKTLLLHVNLWQILHYLQVGAHPETLVQRTDGRREFDNILLITPGEGLSQQHLRELADSGVAAEPLSRAGGLRLFGPEVRVVEIHKLAENAYGEGVSIPIAELGTRNLVIVDEGHKGAGSEARAWKARQETLSRNGFLVEYSATFAQTIGAASGRIRRDLLGLYGKTILFDYSYRHFYADGYGKAFHVLNLREAPADTAQQLMLGGLLIFYQQVYLYQQHRKEARAYQLEQPLWVLLGTSVSRRRPGERDESRSAEKERTDIGEVVAFLRRFLEDSAWAQAHMKRILAGQSGFQDAETGEDLFRPILRFLPDVKTEALYQRICHDVFHGRGGLEVVAIRQAGELGLRVSAPHAQHFPYFGVIHIGDVAAFKRYLVTVYSLSVKEDVISASLFDQIAHPDSPLHLLIGAKKFMEGWSSWRVSMMGLMRVGRGEGPQIIQMFGRGVRLKGKNYSLKRSLGETGVPPWLEVLETLHVVGWKADYLKEFHRMLSQERLWQDLLPLRLQQGPIPGWALVPQPQPAFDATAETWELASDPRIRVQLDWVPQVTALASEAHSFTESSGMAALPVTVRPDAEPYASLWDFDRLYAELVTYKAARGYHNVFVPRPAVREVLSRCTIRLPQDDGMNPERLHTAASRVLKTYLDRYVRLREREAESRHAVPAPLRQDQVLSAYRIQVAVEDEDASARRLLDQLQVLLQRPVQELLGDAADPLPRLYLPWHLFNPLLVEGSAAWQRRVRVSPSALQSAEQQLVKDVRAFWTVHHEMQPYRHLEICLLRNLPKVGVRLFARSGFYPDFILWIYDRATKALRVVFVDPHGLHHEGLEDNDRFAAITALRGLAAADAFRSRSIDLDGFILLSATTVLDALPGAAGRTWTELERSYPLLRQDETGRYVVTLFSGRSGA